MSLDMTTAAASTKTANAGFPAIPIQAAFLAGGSSKNFPNF
jgi:hypothetical protein